MFRVLKSLKGRPIGTLVASRNLLRAYAQSTYILEDMVTTRQQKQQLLDVDLATVIQNLKATTTTQPPQPVSLKHAAVLVPIFQAADGTIHVVLTQRSSKLNTHAHEVCFPGGKRDDQDDDDIATALREAEEELGIPPSSVNVITTLPPVLSKHLLSVTPVVASVPATLAFTPNPNEVSAVFTAPLSMFLTANKGYSYRDLVWGEDRHPYRIHYWDYTYNDGKHFLIWGLTAGMLILVAEKAYNVAAQFEVHPPGVPPYTALAYEKGRLVFRGGNYNNGNGDQSHGAPSSAAMEGARVLDEEAQAAVGCENST